MKSVALIMAKPEAHWLQCTTEEHAAQPGVHAWQVPSIALMLGDVVAALDT
jgi:hypothetical protein